MPILIVFGILLLSIVVVTLQIRGIILLISILREADFSMLHIYPYKLTLKPKVFSENNLAFKIENYIIPVDNEATENSEVVVPVLDNNLFNLDNNPSLVPLDEHESNLLDDSISFTWGHPSAPIPDNKPFSSYQRSNSSIRIRTKFNLYDQYNSNKYDTTNYTSRYEGRYNSIDYEEVRRQFLTLEKDIDEIIFDLKRLKTSVSLQKSTRTKTRNDTRTK